MALDPDDDVWQASFPLPAGTWDYKAALDGTWDENYGGGAVRDGPNIAVGLAEPTSVKFFYDDATHWVTDDQTSVIATVPGSFQTELGCASDWDPGCLRSWLQNADGDGVGRFSTSAPPPSTYEAKVAIDESWDENYGAGGTRTAPTSRSPWAAPATWSRSATTKSATSSRSRCCAWSSQAPDPGPGGIRSATPAVLT